MNDNEHKTIGDALTHIYDDNREEIKSMNKMAKTWFKLVACLVIGIFIFTMFMMFKIFTKMM